MRMRRVRTRPSLYPRFVRHKWVAVGTALMGLALMIAIFAPPPSDGFEPSWLRQLEPHSVRKTAYSGRGSHLATGYAFSGREWRLGEPVSAVRLRLLESLSSADGWKYEAKDENYEIWSKSVHARHSLAITMGQQNGLVVLSSSSSRPINGLERAKLAIRRAPGLEK